MKQAVLENLMEIMKAVSELNSDDLSVILATFSSYQEQVFSIQLDSNIENKKQRILLYESNHMKIYKTGFGQHMNPICIDYHNPKKDQIEKIIRSIWDGVCPFHSYRSAIDDSLTDLEKSHITSIISYRDTDIGTKEYWTESIAIGDKRYSISPVNTHGFYVHGSTGEYIAKDFVDLLKILTDDTKNFDHPKVSENKEEK